MKKIFVLLMLSFLPSLGMATVYYGTKVLFGPNQPPPGPPPLYGIGVYQTPTGNDGTGIRFETNYDLFEGRLTIAGLDYNVDEGVDAWLVPYGTLVSRATIAQGIFEPLHVFDTMYSFTLTDVYGPTTFYLGLATGRGFEGPFPQYPRRNEFGWVALEYRPEDNSLRMVDNAMTYDTAGIAAGTLVTIVPEPGSAIFGLAMVGTILSARRRARG